MPCSNKKLKRMKKLKLIVLIAITISGLQMKGQVNKTDISLAPFGSITPNGYLDAVFDQYGKQYGLNELRIGETYIDSIGNKKTSSILCTAGYFNLFFETGCGMDGSSAIEISRRNVACQVFTDISAFINSPLSSSGNPTKVNIWVRDIGQIIANPSTSGVLGLATSFYNLPQNNTPGFGGIVDNEIWKTIHTGVDSYSGVISPLSSVGGTNSSSGTFYHGMMAFNFNNAGINWNTNLGIALSPSGLYDLYSVILHEVTHSLGFVSLINYNGLSKFGTVYNYYTRYDSFLKNNSLSQNLIVNSGSCSLYNYNFNPLLVPSILTPGCTATPPLANAPSNITICGNAIKYSGSANVEVYTPNCFEAPSSLSHFEDMCYPTASSPYGNDLYFVMSNANGTGAPATKRHLTVEERLVLCDIGYAVNSTYGNIANNNFYDYSVANCLGINVAGINDGITTNGSYSFIGGSGANISISGILFNDYNAVSFECLTDIYDPSANISSTTGNNSTIVNFSSLISGTHLLRYVPISPSGKRGNITYVYVMIFNANCTPTICDIISNGGFENGSNCGPLSDLNSCLGGVYPSIDCWNTISGTPDYFVRNCLPNSTCGYPISVPNSFYCTPSVDTWNSGSAINNKMLGIASLNNWLPNNTLNEAIQGTLSNPLLPGQTYTLNFVARVANHIYNNLPGILQFGGSNNLLAPISYFYNTIPSGLLPLAQQQILNNNTWNHYSVQITNTSPVNINYITLINAGYLNGNPTNSGNYMLIDDISIISQPIIGSLNLPSPLCINQTISDLSSYLSSIAPGGVFSGSGVSVSGGIYSFNAATSGVGSHIIIYSVTNNGCITAVTSTINVVNGFFILTASSSTNTICASTPVTLTASGGTTYTWQPGSINSNPAIFTPTTTTSYVVNGTNASGCTGLANITITVLTNSISISNSIPFTCVGSYTLTAFGATNYTWQPGSIISNSITVNPSSTAIYTVTANSSCLSTISQTILVTPGGYYTPCINTHTSGTNITIPATNLILTSGNYTNINYTCQGHILIANNAVVIFNNCNFNMNPNIRIEIGSKAKIIIRNSHLYGCSSMWEGIRMPNALGASLTIIDTEIEDAINAIYIEGAGQLPLTTNPANNVVINHCLFNKNKRDIYYSNSNYNTLDVSKSLFTSRCLAFDPPFVPLPTNIGPIIFTSPFVTPLNYSAGNTMYSVMAPEVGIEMDEWFNNPANGNQIKLDTRNIFDSHQIGIKTLNFKNLKIEKQVFINGVGFNKEPATTNIGILINKSHNNANTPSTTYIGNVIIGGNGNKTNYFNTLDYGIVVLGGKHTETRLTIDNNDFNKITKDGIYYNGVNNIPGTLAYTLGFATHWIRNNHFMEVSNYSVNMINNKTISITIHDNLITNTVSTASPLPINGGISLIEISNPTSAKYLILRNQMNNVGRGVKADNVNTLTITNNTISVVPATTSGTIFYSGIGINIKNCNTPNVVNNHISGLYNNPSSISAIDFGMQIIDCPKGAYMCNSMVNTLIGTAFGGQNVGTKLTQNSFDNHYMAVYLYNNGLIDIQGNPTTTGASDNRFFNIDPAEFHTYAATNGALFTNGSNSKFYIRNATNFVMPNNGADAFSPASIPLPVTFINSPSPYYNNCAGSPLNLTALANNIANPGIFNATLVRENHTSKRQLYKQLLDLSATPNATLQAFKTANANTSLGRFTMVDSSLSSYFDGSPTALAQAQVYNTFTTANSVEDNQQQFNNLYVSYLQTDSLSAMQKTTLYTLAAKCPYVDGTMVWQARALVHVFNDTLEFENACEVLQIPQTKSSARMSNATTEEDVNVLQLITGQLIPNPNDGNFTLLVDKEVNELSLKVYDIAGKEVCNATATHTNTLKLNCVDLGNGIYIVKVFSNGAYLQSHKLVIQK